MATTPANSLDISEEGVIYFDGTSTFTGIDGGTAGNVLTSNGSDEAPSFQTFPGTPITADQYSVLIGVSGNVVGSLTPIGDVGFVLTSDGGSEYPAWVVPRVFTIAATGINGLSSAATQISVPTGFNAGTGLFFTNLILHVTAFSSVSVQPTITVGTNASSYNNILSTTLLSSLTAAGDILSIAITNTYPLVSLNNIFINVTAGSGTTFTFNAILQGGNV